MTKVILEAGDNYIAASAATIYGSTGSETVKIQDGVTVTTDASVERIEFTRASSDYSYKATSTGVQVSYNGTVVANLATGGKVAFTNGSAAIASSFDATTGTATFTLGGKAVPTTATTGTVLAPTVSNATGEASTLTPSTATSSSTYSIAAAAGSVTEGGAVAFTVTASSASATATTLSYQISGVAVGASVNAASTADFSSVTGTVTLPANATTATFSVVPTNDGVVEGFEGFKVSLLDSSFNTVATSGSVVIADGVSSGQAFTLTVGADTTLVGGAGNDTFTGTLSSSGTTTLNAGDVLNAGAGTDTLSIAVSGSGNNNVSAVVLTDIEKTSVSNFQTSGSTSIDLTQATGLTGISVTASALTGDTAFTGAPNLVTASMANGTGDLSITYADAAVVGATDAQTLTLAGQTGGAFTANATSTGGIETLAIASTTSANTVQVVSSTLKGITVTGDKNLTLTEGTSTLTSLDASALTGKLVFTTDDSTAISVVGGSADDTIVLGATFASTDTVNGGGGNDILSISTAVTTATALANVTNVETLKVNDANNVTLAANIVPAIIDVDDAVTAIATAAGAVTNTTVDATDLAAAKLVVSSSSASAAVKAAAAAISVTGTSAASIAAVAAAVIDAQKSVVTFNTGYTQATTVKLGAEDSVVNSANVDLTVNTTAANMIYDGDITITGGTGTDTLNLTADNSTVVFNSRITNLDKVVIVDGGDVTSGTITAGKTVSLNLGAYATALTIDASALDAGTPNATTPANLDNDETLTVSGASATKALNITGGAGRDTITGGTVNDTLNGGAGDDSINGTAGGNDSINAGDGNDTINMGTTLTTDDTIDGGAGNDILSVTSLSASGLTIVTNIETLSLAGAGSTATLTGNLSFTAIDMSTVDDTAQVLTLSTGYTNSTTVSVDAGDKVVNTLAHVALTVSATAAALTSASATTITGGTGVDTLNVTADNTTANIVATSNLITLVDVINVVDGGDVTTTGSVTAGKDITIDLTSYATPLRIDASALDAGTPNATTPTTLDNDEVLTITNASGGALTVIGGGGADVLVGGSSTAGDSLGGGAGNDTITMGANLTYADTLDGGAGDDSLTTTGIVTDIQFMNVRNVETLTVVPGSTSGTTLSSYFDASGITTINLDTTTANAPVYATGTTVGHTFVAKASSGAAVNESIAGGLGNDTFTFGNGATTADDIDASDSINGGAGTDTIIVQNSETASSTTVAVIDFNKVTAVENVQLGTASGKAATTSEIITLDVSTAITGTTAQTITLNGSVITDSHDTIAITNNNTSTTTKFIVIGGAGADTLEGGAASDTISGGAGADLITGNGGIDSLTGGAGADTFAIGLTGSTLAGADVVSDFATGTDKVQITATLSNTGTIAFDGSSVGTAANNSDSLSLLSSKIGQYYFNTTSAQLILDADGNGLIQSTDVAVSLPGLTSLAATDVNFVVNGGTGADTITTGSGDDVVSGGAGTDSITAGAGNDTITGGAGADAINSGAGSDVIVVNATVSSSSDSVAVLVSGDDNDTGADVITGFAFGTDTLKIVGTGVTDFSAMDDVAVGTATGAVNTQAVAGSYTALTGLISLDGDSTLGQTDDIAITFASPTYASGTDLSSAVGSYSTNFLSSLVFDLTGTTGADGIWGGPGADTIVGGANADFIRGGRLGYTGDADLIFAGARTTAVDGVYPQGADGTAGTGVATAFTNLFSPIGGSTTYDNVFTAANIIEGCQGDDVLVASAQKDVFLYQTYTTGSSGVIARPGNDTIHSFKMGTDRIFVFEKRGDVDNASGDFTFTAGNDASSSNTTTGTLAGGQTTS